MNKKELRKIFLLKRKLLTEEDFFQMNISIKNLLLKHFVTSAGSKIHIYLSDNFNKEVDTWNIIRELQSRKNLIAVPKVFNSDLQNCLLFKNTVLVSNKWNIQEPEICRIMNTKDLEMIILPLLAFDLRGFRVGYGSGYYDKFLKKCKEDTVKIGLSFFDPVNNINDIHSSDIKMNYCITPDRIYTFAAKS